MSTNERADASSSSTEENPAVDLRPLVKNLGGDTEFAIDLVSGFLQRCPDMLGQIRDAASRTDGTAMAAAAHHMSGSAAEFGANQVLATTRAMERLAKEGDIDKAIALLPALEEALQYMKSVLESFASDGKLFG